ncbi:putative DNA-binding domain-containing protein [Primorskyibacter sp. S187A]|uniref:HvfC/BufC family peptide modification chaperone n=1 Tax=Primorskyibacter sp. S187A TaxID=3415130 RepID=UPI003C7EAFF2
MSVEAPFRAALLDPELAIPEGLLDGDGNPAGRRYNVYRNNITASLSEALETGFPAIAKLLGEENFRGLARLYLRTHPPSSARMMLYGAAFGDFLDGFEPLAKYPYLGAVARLEFALRESYHAADHQPLDPNALAVAPEALMQMRLSLAPSVRLLSSPWPIHALWAFNMAGGPKPSGGGQDVVILRAEFDPEPHVLPPGGHAFLSALRAGTTLEAAYEAGLAASESFDLSAILTLLIANSALQGSDT